MELNDQKELFSGAYLRAVAAVAGFDIYKPGELDRDSVDWGIAARGGLGTYKSPRLELQLKCTSPEKIAGDTLPFRLKQKNYDDLIIDVLVPRILLVVAVPSDTVSDWLSQNDERMILRRCGYWLNLRGMAPSVDTGASDPRVTVHLPRAQLFTPEALGTMMQSISATRLL
jgi:hypothetical protein